MNPNQMDLLADVPPRIDRTVAAHVARAAGDRAIALGADKARRIDDGFGARLKSRYALDRAAGRLIHLVGGPTWRVGQFAGSVAKSGYIAIKFEGRSYLAHRLIWVIEHGTFPTIGEIDHINGSKTDNRLCNLRVVNRIANQQNRRRANSNSESGVLGVYWHGQRQRWCVSIKVDGKTRHVGLYDSKEDASNAYVLAKRQHHAGCTI